MGGEWPLASVESLCSRVTSGGTPRSTVQEYYDGGQIPWVTTTEVNYGRIVDTSRKITDLGLAESSAKLVPVGTVIVAMYGRGTAGRVAMAGVPLATNQACCNLIVDELRADARFVYYSLVAAFDGLDALANGSVQQNLSAALIKDFSIPAPRLEEQRAIAHILGTLDDKIELNRRMSETLEAMALALFKSWFVDFEPVWAKAEGRDPGLPQSIADLFPDRLVDSELGEIPEGWEVGTLGDVAAQLREGVNPQDSPGTLFHHFSIPAYDDGKWPKREAGESIKSVKSRVPAGAVLLSKLNPEIERVWLVDVHVDDHAICSTEFIVLVPREPLGRSYVYCLARSSLFRQELEGLVTGTSKSHQRAQVGAVLALQIVRPPDALLRRFENVAASLLARSLACRREAHALAALRDVLLPDLISGDLRLDDPERIIGNVN